MSHETSLPPESEQSLKPSTPTKRALGFGAITSAMRDKREVWRERIANKIYPEGKEDLERRTHEATHDDLTKALNRKGLEEFLESVTRPPQAIMMVDLTNLKAVNDKISHKRGDEVLKNMHTILMEELRGGDAVARVGGDEFVVVLCDDGPGSPDGKDEKPRQPTTPTEAMEGAKSRISISTDNFLKSNPDLDKLGFNLAYGVIAWEEGVPASELIDQAERLMKEHKDDQHSQAGRYR